MNAFGILLLTLLALSLLVQAWLARRQVAHVRRHRTDVPPPFADRISLAAHQRAADYTVARLRFALAAAAANGLLLLGWTYGGALNRLDAFWQAQDWPAPWSGTALLLSFVALSALLDIPFDAWRQLRLERRFGFGRITAALFVADQAKELTVLLVIAAPLCLAALWLMHVLPHGWWLALWALWSAFSVLLLWAYPALIAPLFNRFTPLADVALAGRIEALLRRSGFSSRGVLVADGSRRSSHGNAYFTGLGRSKRIVFFDTLIDALTPEQIEAVLAHELGHFKLHHVQKRLLALVLLSLVAFATLGWLAEQPWFYAGLGVQRHAPSLALVLFLLLTPVVSFFFTPLAAHFSRKHEFEADRFASEQTDTAPLIEALVTLYRDNAGTLSSDPLYSRFHDSHPPAPVRIASLSSRMQG